MHVAVLISYKNQIQIASFVWRKTTNAINVEYTGKRGFMKVSIVIWVTIVFLNLENLFR